MISARPFICVAILIALPPSQARTQTEEKLKAALDGQTLFNQFCVVCHGPMLQGSPLGPALNTAAVRAKSDRELIHQIAEGSLKTGMPAFGRGLTKDEIVGLVTFLHATQQRMTSAATARNKPYPIEAGGDPAKGEALFKEKATCSNCHTISYEGGTIGPDLTHVAERLLPGEIYESVSTPSKKVLRDFQSKSLVRADGQTVAGRFRNETPQSIQILDKTGNLWTTYFKKDFAQVNSDKTSVMPDNLLEKLSPEENKNLFAFLAELK